MKNNFNKNLDNTLYYHANVDEDVTQYMETSIFEWIHMATNRHAPLIIKFRIFKENSGVVSFDFPVFPAEIERTAKNLEDFVNGKDAQKYSADTIPASKNKYRAELLNYIKNRIADEYIQALFANDDKKTEMLKLRLMNNFNYGSFLHAIYSDETILPTDELDYQDNYVNYLFFKEIMEPLAKPAESFGKNAKSESEPNS